MNTRNTLTLITGLVLSFVLAVAGCGTPDTVNGKSRKVSSSTAGSLTDNTSKVR